MGREAQDHLETQKIVLRSIIMVVLDWSLFIFYGVLILESPHHLFLDTQMCLQLIWVQHIAGDGELIVYFCDDQAESLHTIHQPGTL